MHEISQLVSAALNSMLLDVEHFRRNHPTRNCCNVIKIIVIVLSFNQVILRWLDPVF